MIWSKLIYVRPAKLNWQQNESNLSALETIQNG